MTRDSVNPAKYFLRLPNELLAASKELLGGELRASYRFYTKQRVDEERKRKEKGAGRQKALGGRGGEGEEAEVLQAPGERILWIAS